MQKLFIVIAAYNEGNGITKVVKSLHAAKYKNVVVVDDGSADDTGAQAAKAGATVLTHNVNRGQGAALKTGIDYALGRGADIIVTFDADGQHRIEDLPAMIAPVASGQVDITIGSRFIGDGAKHVPLSRRILLKGSVLIVWLFYGVRMTDAHNGFRAMSRKAAQAIQITCDRMAHASEIIEEIHTRHLRYKEVPVIILYTDETMRKGHGGIGQALKVLWNMVSKKIMR